MRPVGVRMRRWARVAGIGAIVGVAALAVVFRNPWFRGNVGVVAPGLVVRSAQPVGDWPRRVQEDHLGSVLNLRGGSAADSWYAEEITQTRDLGVDLYDLPMSRRSARHVASFSASSTSSTAAAYPLLIHCKSGSDRTGLAAALYRLYREGNPPIAPSGPFPSTMATSRSSAPGTSMSRSTNTPPTSPASISTTTPSGSAAGWSRITAPPTPPARSNQSLPAPATAGSCGPQANDPEVEV